MKKRKVLSRKHLPLRLPIISALVYFLALEHFKAPEWLYGAIGLFVVVQTIAVIHSMATEEEIDFDDKK